MNQAKNTSALVNWAGYLGITFLLLLPLSVLMVRSGAWQQGLLLYAIAALGSTVLVLLCGTLMVLPGFSPWRRGISLRLLVALPGAVLLLSLLGGRGDYPPIHDITTNTDDPPLFVTAPEERGEAANSLEIDADVLQQQLAAYPDLQTLHSPLSIDETYTRALHVAGELGWEVYHQDRSAGVIEAVDVTAVMAFRDDVVIRVRGNAGGALLDLRSVSRVGVSDLGANASRIRAFAAAFGNSGA